jgi:hypothetical protein
MHNPLENIIKESLLEFSDHIRKSKWIGREREAVSFYVTGFLSKYVKHGTCLFDLSQIVIEGAVAQSTSSGKRHCNKDLLIWPKPGMTCWSDTWEPINIPLAILEWKVHRPKTSSFKEFNKHDIEWLSWFTGTNPESFGATVALDISLSPSVLHAGLCKNGNHDPQWITS